MCSNPQPNSRAAPGRRAALPPGPPRRCLRPAPARAHPAGDLAPPASDQPFTTKKRTAEVVSACAQLQQASLNAFTASEMLTGPRTTLERKSLV